MSRSYRKYPIVRQERTDRRQSNRFIRHNLSYELPPKGKFHKKVHNDGINWAYRWSLEEARDFYYSSERLQKQTSLEEYLIWYKKTVISK